MNFSVYLNDELGKKLQEIAKKEKVSRNHLIGEAISRLIAEREGDTWSQEILDWSGCPEFELDRADNLITPREDVL